MKISEIRKNLEKHQPEYVAKVAEDVEIHFRVDQSRLTAEMFEFISQAGDKTEEIGLEKYIATAFSMISWWDLEDDAGNEYPRTEEALAELEYPIKWAVMRKLPEAFAPNFQT